MESMWAGCGFPLAQGSRVSGCWYGNGSRSVTEALLGVMTVSSKAMQRFISGLFDLIGNRLVYISRARALNRPPPPLVILNQSSRRPKPPKPEFVKTDSNVHCPKQRRAADALFCDNTPRLALDRKSQTSKKTLTLHAKP